MRKQSKPTLNKQAKQAKAGASTRGGVKALKSSKQKADKPTKFPKVKYKFADGGSF